MGDDQQTITVAELSDGPPLGDHPDQSVDLPVVEILTGRGFITGKSGSGKSNSASVVVENLLDSGFGMLIVDIDGEYYGLKEEYEILHVGADEECDIQVTVEHAGKIASLALEQNVPIILDISSFLDEDEAEELLTAVAKQLFAKEKKLKQPFLLLVEECHEWIPEQGSMGEVGRMLIKIGKRGRKHGLGIVGISQRPADVKKDFITQCDWLVWHRLTWNNDTKVVSRVLDASYASAVEDLDDGEAFMMTDWSESVRRVQFHRKQTFDAGATPGLEDVDRPDLKSVSSDLVSELEEISDRKAQTESKVAELREELDKKNSRIAELEAELQDARDMSRMADQFVDALTDTVRGQNPGRTEQERMRQTRQLQQGPPDLSDSVQADLSESVDDEPDATASPTDEPESADSVSDKPDPIAESVSKAPPQDALAGLEVVYPIDLDTESTAEDSLSDIPSIEEIQAQQQLGDIETQGETPDTATEPLVTGHNGEPSLDESGGTIAMAAVGDGDVTTTSRPSMAAHPDDLSAAGRDLLEELGEMIESWESETRRMLRYYRDQGPAKPVDAYEGASGTGDRTTAYARNRRLRTTGIIEHVGRGNYAYRLGDLLETEYPGHPDEAELDTLVEALEATINDD